MAAVAFAAPIYLVAACGDLGLNGPFGLVSWISTDPKETLAIQVDDSGTLWGKTACFRFAGDASGDGRTLTVGTLKRQAIHSCSTERAAADEKLIATLEGRHAYTLANKRLAISGADHPYRFTAAEWDSTLADGPGL